MKKRIREGNKLTEKKYIDVGNELFDLQKFTTNDVRRMIQKYHVTNTIVTIFKRLGYVKQIGRAKYEAVSVIMTPQMVKMVRSEISAYNLPKPAQTTLALRVEPKAVELRVEPKAAEQYNTPFSLPLNNKKEVVKPKHKSYSYSILGGLIEKSRLKKMTMLSLCWGLFKFRIA